MVTFFPNCTSRTEDSIKLKVGNMALNFIQFSSITVPDI